MINRRAIVPVMLTLAAMLAGFYSIMLSASGHYVEAAKFIMLSMILDGLDGAMARLLKGITSFGAELDTFVDMTSFGLAPALLAYQFALKECGLLGLLLVSGMVLSGASRLSRFRIIDPNRGQKGFLGLPITCAGGWVTMMVFLASSGVPEEWGWTWFTLDEGPWATFVWVSTAALLVLQISHVHYAKMTKNPLVFLPGLIMVLLLFAEIHLAAVAALLLSSFGFYFGFLSPFFRRRANAPAAAEKPKPAVLS